MTEVDPQQVSKELLPFLSVDARTDVKVTAMQYFLGLTGTDEGRQFIASDTKYLNAIVSLLNDLQPAITKDAYLALVNLSTNDYIATKLIHLDEHPKLVKKLISYALDPESQYADIACMLLSNLSRPEGCAKKIMDVIVSHTEEIGFDQIIRVFCLEKHNKYHNKLHYFGPFLSNLTQVKEARKFILDQKRCVIQRLLPFTEYKDSQIRRGGIVGTLRNCCFETECHEWLLSDAVDILPRLLLPLAGPEEFDEDDMEKLPDDLQYLESDKERESDPDLRKMLVESVAKLCSLKSCRQFVKDKNTYVIMRELHKWEKDPAASVAIENMVSLLISDEPEPDMADLNKVDIPSDMEQKFVEGDKKMEEEIEKETREHEKTEKS